MDICTERLEKRQLPIVERWIGRNSGMMTPNDLPTDAKDLRQWFEKCSTEPGHLDCLVLVYETPVGLAGFRQHNPMSDNAVLYLFLYETGYNFIRTATYATIRMLDSAFQEYNLKQITIGVFSPFGEYLAALERMGFCRSAAADGLIELRIEKETFLSRKYLF